MKKLLSLLLALSMLIALGACAGGTGETEEPAATTDSAAEETTAPTEETGFDLSKYDGVDFEIMWQESDSTQIDIVENYAQPAIEAAFPNVNVEWVGNVDVDYTTLAQTGELADVWFGNTSLEMIDSNIILDQKPYLEADTYLQDNFSNPDFFYFRDHIWSLSTGVDNFYTGVLYINQEKFDELGISSDFASYDEMYAACQAIYDAGGITPLVMDGNNGGRFNHFLFQALVVSVEPSAYESILGGGDLNTQPVTDAMTLYANLRDAGFMGTGISVLTTSDAVSAFVEQRAAMLYTASWNNGSVSAAEFDVTVAWWPTANDQYPTGEYQANWGSPLSGWTISASTEYPELAIEIVKCIVKAEAARHLAAGLGTNYIQEAAPVPANGLEEQRLALYNEVDTWYKGFWQNTMDSTCQTEFTSQALTFMSDDHYPVADFVAAIQAAWDSNTYFD